MAERWDVAFVDEVLCRYRIHGQSFTSGLSDVTGTGYLQAERTLREVHAVKRRHAASLPSGRGGRAGAAADRALRRTSSRRVRERTLPDRPFVATVSRAGRRGAARAGDPARAARVEAARGSVARAARGRAATASCVGPEKASAYSTPISAPRIVASALTDSSAADVRARARIVL